MNDILTLVIQLVIGYVIMFSVAASVVNKDELYPYLKYFIVPVLP